MKQYKSFREFYPFYLSQHQHVTCRRLHFFGCLLVLAVLIASFLSRNAWFLLLAPFVGYGPAWIGHFFFEKNHPATFQYPFYSLIGDWVMFTKILRGKIKYTPPS